MTDRLLIIFVKNPIPGRVKTRLAATIGDQAALQVYQKLLEHTKAITEQLSFDKVVYYSEFIDENDFWRESEYMKRLQHSGNLGKRIQMAFHWGFQSGYKDICIIGSDCFELTSESIEDGFASLTANQAVLGPSKDGGYYLWGTDSVAADTLADFQKLGISYAVLDTLADVDVEADLPDILRIKS
jgi:rSAM/selenodomain-associated transferase 1